MSNPDAQWLDLIRDYSSEMASSDYSPGTIHLRRLHLLRFARYASSSPAEVTRDTVIRFLDPATSWSDSYRRSIRVTLRAFYRWAAEHDLLDPEPVRGVRSISAPVGKPRPAPEEAVDKGKTASDPRVATMVRLAAGLGLRCCEIAVVHSDDVFQGPRGWILRVHGKGRKIRLVPCTAMIALDIRNANGYLFPGLIDGHLSAAYVSKLISRALPGKWTAHTLRHRFATRAYVGAAKDIRAVQELLGHASVATTQVYTATEDEVMRQAVDFAA